MAEGGVERWEDESGETGNVQRATGNGVTGNREDRKKGDDVGGDVAVAMVRRRG